MRSSERTFLSSIGFNDMDRELPMHELMCAYLSEEATAKRIFNDLCGDFDAQDCIRRFESDRADLRGFAVGVEKYECNATISRWHPKKKMVFDVFVSGQALMTGTYAGFGPHGRWEREYFGYKSLNIEVKTQVENMGNLLAQLNLYNDSIASDEYQYGYVALAIPFKASPLLKRQLDASNISLIEIEPRDLFEYEQTMLK